MSHIAENFYILNVTIPELAGDINNPFSANNFPENDIARGIASSPLWSEMPASVLVVRHSPPLFAVLGSFDTPDIARLEALVRQVNYALRRLRYVSYTQAKTDCLLLASLLKERFGEEELKKFYFTAIPRGGLIVLGILSYVLDLKPHQLGPPDTPDIPVVVVDDCAITGLRFRAVTKSYTDRNIIFTPLYSSPELRDAIEIRESRVIACISAQDLVDCSREIECGKQAFEEIWQKRLGDDRYWIGLPEYICFAWNEPDRLFWNPVTNNVERGWNILPPEICIKNRVSYIPVYIQPSSEGQLRPPEHVIFSENNDTVVLGDLESKKTYRLNGTAATIWKTIIESGNGETVIQNLIQRYEIDAEALRRDVTAFINDLLNEGLLEHHYEDTKQ